MAGNGATRIGAVSIAAGAWTAELLFLDEQWTGTGSLGQSLWRTSAYLTDWATLAVAVVCTIIAVRGVAAVSPFWRATATMATMLVGVMFAGIGGMAVVFAQGASNVLAHLIIPILMPLYWTVLLPHGGLRWRDTVGLTLFVAAYLAIMFTRGALGDGYPYPFVDVPRVGWAAAATFAGVVAIVASTFALLLVALDRAIARRQGHATRETSGRIGSAPT